MSALLLRWRVPEPLIGPRWRGPQGALHAVSRKSAKPVAAFLVPAAGGAYQADGSGLQLTDRTFSLDFPAIADELGLPALAGAVAAIPEYTASGDGIKLTLGQFSLDYGEIDAGLGLSANFAPKASPVFSGIVSIADGSVAAPSLAFSMDPNTGFYRVTSDRIGMSVGGVNVLDVRAAAFEVRGVTEFLVSGNARVTGFMSVVGAINGLTLRSQGSSGIGIGASALGSATGSRNVAIGLQAGNLLTTGEFNNFYGTFAGYDVQTGSSNTFVGHNTGRGVTTGSWNTIIGANVTGLASNLSQNIILADGLGNIRAQCAPTGNWVFDSATQGVGLTLRNVSRAFLDVQRTADGAVAGGIRWKNNAGTNRWTLGQLTQGTQIHLYDETGTPLVTFDQGARGITVDGAMTAKHPSSATPSANGQITFEFTNDTTLKIKARGSDGIVREASLALA